MSAEATSKIFSGLEGSDGLVSVSEFIIKVLRDEDTSLKLGFSPPVPPQRNACEKLMKIFELLDKTMSDRIDFSDFQHFLAILLHINVEILDDTHDEVDRKSISKPNNLPPILPENTPSKKSVVSPTSSIDIEKPNSEAKSTSFEEQSIHDLSLDSSRNTTQTPIPILFDTNQSSLYHSLLRNVKPKIRTCKNQWNSRQRRHLYDEQRKKFLKSSITKKKKQNRKQKNNKSPSKKIARDRSVSSQSNFVRPSKSKKAKKKIKKKRINKRI